MSGWRLATLLLAVIAASPASADEALEQGKADFAKLCAPCHGVDAKGHGPEAAKLPKKPLHKPLQMQKQKLMQRLQKLLQMKKQKKRPSTRILKIKERNTKANKTLTLYPRPLLNLELTLSTTKLPSMPATETSCSL